MRVLITGGRAYKEKLTLWYYLDSYGPPEITELVCGMAKTGVDKFAVEWAKRYGIPILEFHPNWDKFGRAAGPIRNQQMIDEGKPEAAIVFAGGNGTADMLRRIKKAEIPYVEV